MKVKMDTISVPQSMCLLAFKGFGLHLILKGSM